MRQEFFVATAASQEIMSVPVVDEFLYAYHNFLVSKQNTTTIRNFYSSLVLDTIPWAKIENKFLFFLHLSLYNHLLFA